MRDRAHPPTQIITITHSEDLYIYKTKGGTLKINGDKANKSKKEENNITNHR